MKAVILAAGEGSRLRPYTLDRPKCLVEIDGKRLLDRQLAILRAERISGIVVIGGYRADMLRLPGVELRVNPDYAVTNMVWTLFCAEGEFDNELVVSYGDIVYSRDVLRALLASRADAVVAIDLDWESYWATRHENPLDDAETLKLAPDGRILEIGQRPQSLADIEGQYIGLMKFSVRGLRALETVFHDARAGGSLCGKPVEKAYMTDLLQATIDHGHPVHAVPVRGGWVEVDTVGDLHSPVTRSRIERMDTALDAV